ncbi:hypothetical protein Q4555_07665 [Octadecabacter sp. 1_MG-2023]|uniref:hypothetical protein n=1 Tax=unclassified Octadecabacter TaxID=196158 RepID=UPI001C09BB0B|nr:MULTISPECIES: hypothetical protein [unclassified Octadecabacter]MBU2994170.1 hypothetical protein [Octadecabacter sp. B2R22]MDO6734541.1 hypothetical protein [Octadecabacter sp. 1_MG-2023]
MIDPVKVSQYEKGLYRLYSVDLAEDYIAAFADPNHSGEADAAWPLKDALGATHLDEDYIEVFDVADLADMGLAQYMITGNGVAESDIEPYRELLDGVSGYVVMVATSAFGGVEQALAPVAPLRYIAAFKEDGMDVTFEQLPNPDPQAVLEDAPARKKPSDAAMSGRIATVALLVMAALVWVMIKVAG